MTIIYKGNDNHLFNYFYLFLFNKFLYFYIKYKIFKFVINLMHLIKIFNNDLKN